MFKKYGYIILLGFMVMVFTTVTMIQEVKKQEEYTKIVVSKGDTLWKITKEYGEPHKANSNEFIKWVVNENKLLHTEIKVGQELVIPIKQENLSSNNEYVLSK
jgi:LysM repeat protein